MRKITHIYIHTAAAASKGVPVDQSAKTIRDYHTRPKKDGGRGWKDIGYNAVCRFDGTIEAGRPHDKVPAGVGGDNAHTLHLCFTGHGDIRDLTPQQKKQGAIKVAAWLEYYNLVDAFKKNPKKVVRGHREFWILKMLPIQKTCPGKLVNCDEFRKLVMEALK